MSSHVLDFTPRSHAPQGMRCGRPSARGTVPQPLADCPPHPFPQCAQPSSPLPDAWAYYFTPTQHAVLPSPLTCSVTLPLCGYHPHMVTLPLILVRDASTWSPAPLPLLPLPPPRTTSTLVPPPRNAPLGTRCCRTSARASRSCGSWWRTSTPRGQQGQGSRPPRRARTERGRQPRGLGVPCVG